MKTENKVFALYCILGIMAGAVTYYIGDILYSAIAAIVIMYIIAKIMKKVLKSEEKIVWFFKKGGYIYIFLWLVTWILIYNLV